MPEFQLFLVVTVNALLVMDQRHAQNVKVNFSPKEKAAQKNVPKVGGKEMMKTVNNVRLVVKNVKLQESVKNVTLLQP